MDRTVLERKAVAELREIASTMELAGYKSLKKSDLIDLIIDSGDGEVSTNGELTAVTDDGDPARTADAAGDGTAQADGDSEQARGDDVEDDESRDERTENAEADDGDEDEDEDEDQHDRTRNRSRGGSDGDDDGPERQRTRSRSRTKNRDKRDQDRGEDRDKNRGDKQDEQKNAQDQRNTGDGKRNKDDSGREIREGVLDLLPEGYGFLRTTGYLAGDQDVYVSQSTVRRHNLRRGDLVRGPIRHNKGKDKFPALAHVAEVENGDPDSDGQRRDFKKLTPYFPTARFQLETDGSSPVAMRIVDMISPIGKGQRGLIVSPPKAGKTTVLKQLAQAIDNNSPDTALMVLLVDERPEEVTDFERSTRGEVISSTFDRPADDHTQVAELAIERAKRLVERGRDVVILLDSITRLARAYNLAAPASGRILSGGVDSAALYPPKRFFGAARNIEEGGSLTIIATALIETGSKMDEVIFEEFKGTGNMELRLSRQLEQKRIFPAVDIEASGTRKEELLLSDEELSSIWKLRRVLHSMDSAASLELLVDKLRATKTNTQFLQLIQNSKLA